MVKRCHHLYSAKLSRRNEGFWRIKSIGAKPIIANCIVLQNTINNSYTIYQL